MKKHPIIACLISCLVIVLSNCGLSNQDVAPLEDKVKKSVELRYILLPIELEKRIAQTKELLNKEENREKQLELEKEIKGLIDNKQWRAELTEEDKSRMKGIEYNSTMNNVKRFCAIEDIKILEQFYLCRNNASESLIKNKDNDSEYAEAENALKKCDDLRSQLSRSCYFGG